MPSSLSPGNLTTLTRFFSPFNLAAFDSLSSLLFFVFDLVLPSSPFSAFPCVIFCLKGFWSSEAKEFFFLIFFPC